MLFLLFVYGLVVSPVAYPNADSLSSVTLQQALIGDAAQSCVSLPTLRSTSLQTALIQLYQNNDYKTLWEGAQQRAALKTELEQLVDDGLSPEDYGFALQARPPVKQCDELRISSQYLLALEHLSRGRLAQADHEPYWQANALPPPSAPLLSELALTGLRKGIAASFEQARPALPQYRALRAAYAAMDRQPASRAPLPPGPVLRPGMSDERIEQLAAQLQQDGFLLESPAAYVSVSNYNGALVEAVRLYQAQHGLQVDGIIGPLTLTALNISPAQRVQQVRINLERLRWVNAQRSDYLLLINVASARLQLMRGNDTLWRARAQVGRSSRPTPLLVSYINRITLNPGWTVPPTILREDILPKIRRNPDYLGVHNLRTLDTQGKPLDPRHIDWNNPRGIILRQPPGPTNPLGEIVFRLPNPFSIYLHDTPSKHLFQQTNRSVSSGCVRVENANELAAQLFAGLSFLEHEHIAQQRASKQTHEIALTNGPRVILAYWTAFANSEGQLAFVADSYGLDQALVSAMAIMPAPKPAAKAPIAVPAEAGCAVYDRAPS
ncbi:L,D-transpeptidase family protein [Halopseudomonas pelagia]|uniref:L,D-transpeptidase family protein n=1 Tax=Halopseudomonas pelagia TaxID=553151 RepID=UPI0003A5F652|nr:L,D-transpeptidase family protein [Halopseudomonas pelagia]